jgi:hypothetical protein
MYHWAGAHEIFDHAVGESCMPGSAAWSCIWPQVTELTLCCCCVHLCGSVQDIYPADTCKCHLAKQLRKHTGCWDLRWHMVSLTCCCSSLASMHTSRLQTKAWHSMTDTIAQLSLCLGWWCACAACGCRLEPPMPMRPGRHSVSLT